MSESNEKWLNEWLLSRRRLLVVRQLGRGGSVPGRVRRR